MHSFSAVLVLAATPALPDCREQEPPEAHCMGFQRFLPLRSTGSGTRAQEMWGQYWAPAAWGQTLCLLRWQAGSPPLSHPGKPHLRLLESQCVYICTSWEILGIFKGILSHWIVSTCTEFNSHIRLSLITSYILISTLLTHTIHQALCHITLGQGCLVLIQIYQALERTSKSTWVCCNNFCLLVIL